MTKSQLVIVPSPGAGHLIATVEFAKLLIKHDPHLSITVFIIKPKSDDNQSSLDAYTDSLLSSPDFPPTLHLIHLPSPYNNSNSHSDSSAFNLFLSPDHIPPVKQAVSDLIHRSESTKLAGFIVDMFCTSVLDVADDFGVPAMVFYTSGAACLGFFFHLHTLRQRDNIDTTSPNFKDSVSELAIPCLVNPAPVNYLPRMILRKEMQDFLFTLISGLKRAKVFIVNTFEELESHAIRSLSQTDITVYPVGPLFHPKTDHKDKPASHVIQWLDHQPSSSVIFLCFGSKVSFHKDQVTEIARALENAGHRFVWSLRKPSPNGPMQQPTDYPDVSEVLPDGFLDRTAEIGRVIGWAPQTDILAHPAIGGFVSHCGWNSILESIFYGVPIATWPLYAEQQLNAFQLVRDLNLAVEIVLDFDLEIYKKDGQTILRADKIEKGIKELMKEESEVRKNVKRMGEVSRMALSEGGSSYSALNRFIRDINNMAV